MKKFLILVLGLLSINAYAQNFNGEGSEWKGDIGDFTSKKDIDYVGDGHIGHKLDIYFPADNKKTHNVVIHIYGSAWGSNSSKGSADLGSVGVSVLNAGYIFVTPNHRTYKDALYPAQINDIKAVVRYLRGNAQELGIDTSFIAVSGFSSGGHLASLMGVTRTVKSTYTVGSTTMDIEGNLGNYTQYSSWVDAVCDWSGPVDCRDKTCGSAIPMSPENDMVGGCDNNQCPDKHALLGANTFITAESAPTIVLHGTGDYVVPSCEGSKFYDNLKAAGVDCELFIHNGDHGVNNNYTQDMVKFLNRIRSAKMEASTGINLVGLAGDQIICNDGSKLFVCNGEVEEGTEYAVIDVTGKTLFQGTLTNEGINISSLNRGIYFLRTNGGNKTYKFIK